jgi:hypothetical protein
LDQLFIDPAYQRTILESGKANVRRMMEQFSWALFGALVVSQRAPRIYAVIDGQHRATAALNRGGIDKVPCVVLSASVEAEARAFSDINRNVTRIHPLQSFRAAVAGGDPEAKEIVAACAEAGVVIVPYPKAVELMKPGETCALSGIRKSLKRHGEQATITALIMLRTADPDAYLPGAAVDGMCAAVPNHPDWHRDAAKIGEAMGRNTTLLQLVSRAQERKLARGGTVWSNFAALIESKIAAASVRSGAPLNRMMAGR